ncbi:MAG: hypothetical protein KGM93_12280 [Sphingomonadales bacterium]|nr:hypothetical protein [Sphingomonadales bacterium]
MLSNGFGFASLTIVDRLKDMIVTGGEDANSTGPEQARDRYPAVSQCAVTGRHDAKWDEAVHAEFMLREGLAADAGELATNAA